MVSFYILIISILLNTILAIPVPESTSFQHVRFLRRDSQKRTVHPTKTSSTAKLPTRRGSRSFGFDSLDFGYYPTTSFSEPLNVWNGEDLYLRKSASNIFSNRKPVSDIFAPKPLWNHITFKDELLPYEVGRNGHITPDYTSGFENHDPLLLTGHEAKLAVAYLYSRELFFSDIPHLKLMLKNQQDRIDNGLGEHKLGSLRPTSPFFRHEGRQY